MKLVPEARKAWKWFSIQINAVGAAIPLVWVSLPPELKASVPEKYLPWVMMAVFIGGMIGRLIDQGDRQK